MGASAGVMKVACKWLDNLVRESVCASAGIDVSRGGRAGSLYPRLLGLRLDTNKHNFSQECKKNKCISLPSKHLSALFVTCSSILSCLSRAASTASKNSSSLMRLFGPSCRYVERERFFKTSYTSQSSCCFTGEFYYFTS